MTDKITDLRIKLSQARRDLTEARRTNVKSGEASKVLELKKFIEETKKKIEEYS